LLLVKYSRYLPLPTCSCSNLLFVLTLLCNPYLALQLDDVDVNVDKSRRTIGGMVRRMDRNKWIIGLVIAVLVLAILVILYFKFVH